MKIEFDSNAYQFTHGHGPRGYGSWAFAVDRERDLYFWVPGSMLYTDAKAAARRMVQWHARNGTPMEMFDVHEGKNVEQKINLDHTMVLYACT